MAFLSVALLVASSLALVGALALSIYQRKSGEERRLNAIQYILDGDTDADDLAVLLFFLRLREIEDLTV